MKVLFITHYTEMYGANRSLVDLISGLKRFDVSSFVICPFYGEITKELEKRGIPYDVVGFFYWFCNNKRHRFKRLCLNLKALPCLLRIIRKLSPDIIYSNSSVIFMGFLSALILRKPHVWHVREFGKLDYGISCDWGEKIFKYCLNKSDAVIAVSKALKEVILKGVYAKKIVIYNGVASKAESNDIIRQADLQTKKQEYIFLIMGALLKNKNQEEAIKAFAELSRDFPNAKLIIAGCKRGDYADKLEKIVKTLVIEDKVEFLGYVSNPFKVILEADAVLVPGRYEAMGRVAAESMLAGKPVIGHNSGGTAEIITHGESGFLYTGNHRDLAVLMKSLIENPELSYKLGHNARQIAVKRFLVEKYAKSVHDVLNKVYACKSCNGK